MRTFELPRVYLPKETLGSMYFEDGKMICKTMELPYRNNKVGKTYLEASCIPEGTYIFEAMPPTDHYPDGYFRCRAVSGRTINKNFKDAAGNYMSSILMHPITYVSGLLGCIGVGSRFADLDKDGVPDMEASKIKLAWMVKNLPKIFAVRIFKKL